MAYTKLASAIYNDIYAGLRGYHIGNSLSIELLEDEIVNMRLAVIKEYLLKGILPVKDLLTAINCIEIDCNDLERCCIGSTSLTPQMHFEIPALMLDFGSSTIEYLGTADRMNSYIVYVGSNYSNTYGKYRKRNKLKPYVYIDPALNNNGKHDCWVFNAPFVKNLSIVAVFKDLRQVQESYPCCFTLDEGAGINSVIENEIKSRLTREKIQYYRLLATPISPNDLQYK